MGGLLAIKKNWKLKDLIESLEKSYCHKISIEYAHITNQEEVVWIRDKFEKISSFEFSAE
jgi:2-oxoglutarate dehydrogenase E1 component